MSASESPKTLCSSCGARDIYPSDAEEQARKRVKAHDKWRR